jgi:hypothetical protein
MLAFMPALSSLKVQDDPEAIFQWGSLLCDAGDHDSGFTYLRRAVDKGYFAAPALTGRPQFDAVRGRADFNALLEDAEAGRARARAAFQHAGGDRLLGM